MKEFLITRWCHSPWHAWLKHEPRWVGLFAELWARIPESALKRVLTPSAALIALPPVAYMAQVLRITEPLPQGAQLLQLEPSLLDRPRSEAVAILAHELAHLCVDATEDALFNDLEADRLASEWGFGDGLLSALGKDVEPSHPRLQALRCSRTAS